MDSNAKQLVDSLADHLALYHSTSNSKASKSQFRNNAVQWMSSLTAEQRQAALTTVDESWLAIVLQMHHRLQTDGPGFFILLPDVLVSQNDRGKYRHGFKPQADDIALPSLCYRKAKGLLARVNTDNEAELILMQSIRLFSSTEGEFSSPECSRLDSLTVAEDLVKDADRFFAVMDTISHCDFLRSVKPPPSASNWEELPWLKAKGYYSLAAFVANKLELSLRLSWIHSHGKKRSSRMNSTANSHEVHKNGRDLAGVASNVFWRKKACVDWWSKVNETTRAEAFKLAVAKVTKLEVKKIVQGNADRFRALYKDQIFSTAETGLLKLPSSFGDPQAIFVQDSSVSATCSLVSALPSAIRSRMGAELGEKIKLNKVGREIPEVLVKEREEAARCMQKAIKSLVRASSLRQALSGCLAVGGVNATSYLAKKVSKAWRSRH